MQLIYASSLSEVSIDNAIVFIAEDKQALPSVGSVSDAGWDIKALRWHVVDTRYFVAHTGVKYFLPDGYELQLRAKSGTFAKTGLILTNAVGTLDASYRGEILASCYQIWNAPHKLLVDEYLFQLVISIYMKPNLSLAHIDRIVLVENKDEYKKWNKLLPSARGLDGGIVRNLQKK